MNAPIDRFLEYAHWFQERAAPDVDVRDVRSIDNVGARFALMFEDGERTVVDRVVVAAGLAPFAWRPPPFDALDPALASHSSDHAKLDAFAGLDVIVVGGGQSALESAALLHESGAHVEVLTRAPTVRWLASDAAADADERPFGDALRAPTDVGGRLTGWVAAYPDAFRTVPANVRAVVAARCTRPAGAGWLRPRLADVTITTGAPIMAATAERGRVHITCGDGSERTVDHVLMGTGFRIDVTRYPFLGSSILRSLAVQDGYPVLGPGLESSVPGLHFLGAPAALSFGPIMRFVVGTWFAAPALTQRIEGRRQPLLRRSF